MVQTLSVLKI